MKTLSPLQLLPSSTESLCDLMICNSVDWLIVPPVPLTMSERITPSLTYRPGPHNQAGCFTYMITCRHSCVTLGWLCSCSRPAEQLEMIGQHGVWESSPEPRNQWGLRTEEWSIENYFLHPAIDWGRLTIISIYSISGQTQTRPSNLEIKLKIGWLVGCVAGHYCQ